MQPYDYDFDDFEFADYAVVGRILREQMREEQRLRTRRTLGPRNRGRYDDDYGDYDDYDDNYDDDYEDYDDEEFDEYSGSGADA